MPFGRLAGGVLCETCRRGQKQIISISAPVLAVLARLARADDESWRELEIDAGTYGELRGILNHYWAHLLGHPLQMHRYLGQAVGRATVDGRG